jgi:quercetin dioxygenase-like cupin family protein
MAIVRDQQAPRLTVLSDTMQLLLRSDESPHQMAAMTVTVDPGGLVPLHAHRVEEEGYFVLAGRLALTVGSTEYLLMPGDFAHVPPRTAHGYRNPGPDPVRFLAWTVGGPIDRFFAEMSDQVRVMPDDAPRMMELMERYGIDMLQ